MESENHQASHCIAIPSALAKAIVAAQAAGESVRRDGNCDKGDYTTADEIAFVARKALTEHGAAWVRLDVELQAGGLSADADIGNQAYVGDVVERWAIVHEEGGVLLGSSRMPVITSRGRPHDKAVGASLTYDAGAALRGALCMDRESKDAIDRRPDDNQALPAGKPKAKGKSPANKPDSLGPRLRDSKKGDPLSAKIVALMEEAVAVAGVEWSRVWKKMLAEAAVDVPAYVAEFGEAPDDAGSLTFRDATAVKAELERRLEARKKADAETPAAEPAQAAGPRPKDDCAALWLKLRQRAPDDHTDTSWKADWARFAGIATWPDRPTEKMHIDAAAGMRRALTEIDAP
jgi:hypothetical protein